MPVGDTLLTLTVPLLFASVTVTPIDELMVALYAKAGIVRLTVTVKVCAKGSGLMRPTVLVTKGSSFMKDSRPNRTAPTPMPPQWFASLTTPWASVICQCRTSSVESEAYAPPRFQVLTPRPPSVPSTTRVTLVAKAGPPTASRATNPTGSARRRKNIPIPFSSADTSRRAATVQPVCQGRSARNRFEIKRVLPLGAARTERGFPGTGKQVPWFRDPAAGAQLARRLASASAAAPSARRVRALGSGTISKRLVMPTWSKALSVNLRVMPIAVAEPGPAAWSGRPVLSGRVAEQPAVAQLTLVGCPNSVRTGEPFTVPV